MICRVFLVILTLVFVNESFSDDSGDRIKELTSVAELLAEGKYDRIQVWVYLAGSDSNAPKDRGVKLRKAEELDYKSENIINGLRAIGLLTKEWIAKHKSTEDLIKDLNRLEGTTKLLPFNSKIIELTMANPAYLALPVFTFSPKKWYQF